MLQLHHFNPKPAVIMRSVYLKISDHILRLMLAPGQNDEKQSKISSPKKNRLLSQQQSKNQRWSRGHKAHGQGHKKNLRPRPRTAFPRTDTLEAKDSLSENRHFRGQGQECSRPRTQAQVLSKKKKGLDKSFSGDLKKKKKKVFTKIFQAISTKKRFSKDFSSAPQNFNYSKNTAVLEPRTGQF